MSGPIFTANIGLAEPRYNTARLSSIKRLKAALNAVSAHMSWCYLESNLSGDEPTVVVRAQAPATWDYVDLYLWAAQTASVCGQDCIAIQIDGCPGVLCGPFAEQWAPFEPALFIQPKRRIV